MGGKLLPPLLYLRSYMVTATSRFEVSADCHIVLTANKDGKFYVSIMDRKNGVWTPRQDETQQWFPNRLQAEAWAATMHKKERKVVELRASVGAPLFREQSCRNEGCRHFGSAHPDGVKECEHGTAP